MIHELNIFGTIFKILTAYSTRLQRVLIKLFVLQIAEISLPIYSWVHFRIWNHNFNGIVKYNIGCAIISKISTNYWQLSILMDVKEDPDIHAINNGIHNVIILSFHILEKN